MSTLNPYIPPTEIPPQKTSFQLAQEAVKAAAEKASKKTTTTKSE